MSQTNFRREDHDPEGCPGCRPVVLDPQTGKVVLEMTAKAFLAFKATTPETRKSWHRVTCLNSRDPNDLALSKVLLDAISKELEK
jgi:hypothetical protein